jgi:hypothetical protein
VALEYESTDNVGRFWFLDANPWRAAQYNAWCRHNGHHYTNKRGDVDWNALIVWKLRSELEFQWDIVQDEVKDVFRDLQATVSKQFGALETAISAVATPNEFRTQLLAIIAPRMESCRYLLTLVQEKLAHDVK